MRPGSPAEPLRQALWLCVLGFSLLTLFALCTYRAGGPGWPHAVVDGGAWLLVAATACLCVRAAWRALLGLAHRQGFAL